MFLKHLRQKPDKMAPFENNNKPCKVFNHNKESKGRPIYFSFYTFHLSARPECRMQMPAICSSSKWSLRRVPWVPSFPPAWLLQADETPGCWQRRMAQGTVRGVGGSWAVWDVSRCQPRCPVCGRGCPGRALRHPPFQGNVLKAEQGDKGCVGLCRKMLCFSSAIPPRGKIFSIAHHSV